MRGSLWYCLAAGILLPLFYFVLIGLVLPFAPPLLFGISAGNALMIPALVMRPAVPQGLAGPRRRLGGAATAAPAERDAISEDPATMSENCHE